jgi:hypothetical protein
MPAGDDGDGLLLSSTEAVLVRQSASSGFINMMIM